MNKPTAIERMMFEQELTRAFEQNATLEEQATMLLRGYARNFRGMVQNGTSHVPDLADLDNPETDAADAFQVAQFNETLALLDASCKRIVVLVREAHARGMVQRPDPNSEWVVGRPRVGGL